MNKWNKLRKQNLGAIPQEASQNLQAPETFPLRKNIKVNIRTKPLNFKVSKEFYRQLRKLAVKEDCFMVEVVEKAIKEYREKENNQIKKNNSPVEAKYFDQSHIRVAIQKNSKEPMLKN